MNFLRPAVFSVIAISLIAAFSLSSVQADDPADQQTKNALIEKLHIEKEKQTMQIKVLQESIQKVTHELDLPYLEEREKIFRQNAISEDVKLTALEANHQAAANWVRQADHVPFEILMLLDPELKELDTRKEKLQEQRELIAKNMQNPMTDPRILRLDEQIKEIEDKKGNIAGSTDENSLEKFRKRIRDQEELKAFRLEQQIQGQRLLVAALMRKYTDQRREKFQHVNALLTISLWQSQIDRANKLVEEIDRRILALQLIPQVDDTKSQTID